MEFLKEIKIIPATAEEIISAMLSFKSDGELTDRELWIPENFSGSDC